MPGGAYTLQMNFAGNKLNGFYKETNDLSVRERKLIAENKRLKKRNRRLSGAMVYLVGHIEKRLPFFNSKLKDSQKSTPPLPISDPASPKKKQSLPKTPSPKQVSRKIIGQAWTPENLNRATPNTPNQSRRKDPLSMQQIFADKKRERDDRAETDVDISEVVFDDKSLAQNTEVQGDKTPLYDRAQAAKEASTEDQTEQSDAPSTSAQNNPPTPETKETIEIAQLVPDDADTDLTPALAPEEVNILAAPTRDKKQDVFQPQPSEVITDREVKKTSAREASLAYMAVSVAAKPVPTTEILTDDDISGMDENEIIADQVAHQNDVMRAAMLRRVNRLRW